MKCNQPRSGVELGSPRLFSVTGTITPRAPLSISLSLFVKVSQSLSLSLYIYIHMCVCVCARKIRKQVDKRNTDDGSIDISSLLKNFIIMMMKSLGK